MNSAATWRTIWITIIVRSPELVLAFRPCLHGSEMALWTLSDMNRRLYTREWRSHGGRFQNNYSYSFCYPARIATFRTNHKGDGIHCDWVSFQQFTIWAILIIWISFIELLSADCVLTVRFLFHCTANHKRTKRHAITFRCLLLKQLITPLRISIVSTHTVAA